VLRFDKILVPSDFTVHSISAFHIAAALARAHAAELVVMHVVETPVAPSAQFGARPLPEAESRRKLLERLEHFKSLEPASTAELLLVHGAPADEITAVAIQKKCGLIVMGTHGRTGLSRLVMGSVAQQVTRTAPCPVLTVRFPMSVEPGPETSTGMAPPVGGRS
jgi:nucleotide-binding universal stress UspA family protein